MPTDETTEVNLETINSKLDLIMEKLELILEPRIKFDSREVARSKGKTLPGGG